ncbi:MAG: hypothetical protein M1826_002650 [Phylliscum demangeonii]|nr:MAG: hypothetical protein M1826_002650 [Phylliscum demangeonii]
MISYDTSAPDSVVEDAKTAIKLAGGEITHDYKELFKGFAANVHLPDVDSLKTAGQQYGIEIKEDETISVNGK